MIKYFDHDSLSILTEINDKHLVSENGVPLSEEYSDHLPLYFELNMEDNNE